MSLPARRLTPQAEPTRRAPAPSRRPVARPPTSTLPHASRRARHGSTSFWVITAVVVTVLVVGVVSLSALLVRTSFREQQVRARLADLAEQHEALALEVVGLSSPTWVASWARAEGLVAADEVEVLRVKAARS